MNGNYLANHCRLATTDPDEAESKTSVFWEKHRRTVMGQPFRLRFCQANLRNTELSFIEEGAPLRIECAGPAHSMFRVAMNESGRLDLLLNGQPCAQTMTQACLHAPGQHLCFGGGPMSCLLLGFDARYVRSALLRRFGRLPAFETWVGAFSLTSASGAALRSLTRWTAQELDKKDTVLFTSVRAAASLERTLLALFLDCLASQYPIDLDRRREDLALAQVRRIEEWIDAHVGDPIGIEEMAAVVGVSVRSLQVAFRRLRGISPMQALQRRRLDHAHRKLSHPEAETTVTTVAIDCGFFHFGRFSVRYRQAFGESPSATLARGRRDGFLAAIGRYPRNANLPRA